MGTVVQLIFLILVKESEMFQSSLTNKNWHEKHIKDPGPGAPPWLGGSDTDRELHESDG